MSNSSRLSLAEAWRAQRDRLRGGGAEEPSEASEDARQRLHVLEFLIERYQGTPVAEQEVCEPPAHEAVVNERAIVVHRHIPDLGGGARSAAEARQRIKEVLHRRPQPVEDEPQPPASALPHVPAKLWDKIGKRLRWGFRADRLMRKALQESPYLPSVALQHLFRRVDRINRTDLAAVELILQCENKGVYDLVARAWRNRVVLDRDDEVRRQLDWFFMMPLHRAEKRRRVRLELADDRGLVRCAALRLLQQIGDLRDTALLADLLSLPPQPDDAPGERQLLLETLQLLADRSG